MTAVRRMLVQSSLAELKQIGVFERYARLIDPDVLAELLDSIGPGWLPVEHAIAHYMACSALDLPFDQIEALGRRAGDKMQGTLLVSSAKNPGAERNTNPWDAMGAFWRMGRRMFQGGSAQYIKLGPNELLIETIHNPLLSCPYYRTGHVGFMTGAFHGIGVHVTSVKLADVRSEVHVRITWE